MASLDPLNTISIGPHPQLHLSSTRYEDALSLLFSIEPVSSVAPAIGPEELAVPRLQILSVVTDILSAIGPLKQTFTVHFVVEPVALVPSFVAPNKYALAMIVVL